MSILLPKYKNFTQERIIGEHKIYLPDPPDIKDIHYKDLPKEDQFFRREFLPDSWNSLPKEDRATFANKHWDIRGREGEKGEGFWFWNNGELEWMSPNHYFYANWWKIGKVKIPKEYIFDSRDAYYPFFTDADRDWHYLAEDCYYDKTCGGLFTIEFRRGGKALDINTKIPTPTGWRTMESLKEGELVFGSDGKPTKITYVSPVMITNDCYKITFSDTSSVIADADHLWIVHNKTARQNIKLGRPVNTQVKKTSELIEKLKLYPNQKGGESNWSIKNPIAVEYPKKELNIPPYILGLWLGDGCSHNASLTNIDSEIINDWVEYGKTIGLNVKQVDEINYHLRTEKSLHNGWEINSFKEKLRNYDLIKNKHIPIDYLQSSVTDRLELLQGLMDTDGSIKKNGATCEFCSKNKGFLLQVKEVISSLGMKVTDTSKFNKKYDKHYYYLRFSPNGLNPFKLKRKADKVKFEHSGGWRKDHRYIVSIEKVESVPVKCISVDNADSSYLFGENFIVTHNTYRVGCFQYEKVSKTHDAKGGTQSRDDSDSYNVFEKIIFGWRNLPPFFKPVDVGNNNPQTDLVFDEPKKMSSKNLQKVYSDILHSWIDYGNASEGYYDGKEQIINIQDEIGKINSKRGINLLERIRVVIECCFIMGEKVGMVLGTTTVEEMEKAGGKQAKELWKRCTTLDLEAKLDTNLFPTGKALDEFGFTQSKMKRYLRPSYKGFLGTDIDGECLVDRYGYSREEKAKEYFLKRRKNKKGAELASEKRKFPLEINDCWVSDVKKSTYDTDRVEQQLAYNQTIPSGIVQRGNFVWHNGVEDTYVEWHFCDNGRWEMIWMPEHDLRNKANIKNGKKSPANTDIGCFGLDPYDNKTTVDDRKSNAASYGIRKYDPLNPYDTGIFVIKYVARPELPEIMWEDMIKQAVFYGWEILIESNKIGTINHFRRRGYINYLMFRPEETQTASSKKMEEPGIPMSGDEARQALIYATESYIINNVGLIEKEGEVPRMGKCYFNEVLNDWLEFDFEQKWTKFDSMVGAGLAILGSRKYIPIKKEIKKIELFPRFKMVNGISQRISDK